MLPIPYFQTDALRQRLERHLQAARASVLIDDQALQRLQSLCEAGVMAQSLSVYGLTLEDASPVPLALASALLIVDRHATGETLYLDTLSLGLERFTDRTALSRRLRKLFVAREGLEPVFEQERLEAPLLEQRRWRIIDHQAQTLSALADELETLPSLSAALAQALPARLAAVWPACQSLEGPLLLQIVEASNDPSGPDDVIHALSPERMALRLLSGAVLAADQRLRLLGPDGQVLATAAGATLSLRPEDLKDDHERLLASYWTFADRSGLNRRDRAAQVIADGFAHGAWQLEQIAHPDSAALTHLAGLPLYALSPWTISRLSVTVGNTGPFKLVSLYLVHLPTGGYALYSPLKGIRHLADWQALTDLLGSPAGRRELGSYLSLDDQHACPASGELQLQGYELSGAWFPDCIDSIIALQKRNLGEVFKRQGAVETLLAMFDDALDVRALIDARLPRIRPDSRWLDDGVVFATRWPVVSPPLQVSAPQTSALQPFGQQAMSWMEQITLLDAMLEHLARSRPGLQVLARQALNPWLVVLGDGQPMAAEDLQVRWTDSREPGQEGNQLQVVPASEPTVASWLNLADLLLERMSGLRSTPVPSASPVFWNEQERSILHRLSAVDPVLIERLLGQAAPRLASLCAASVAAFHSGLHREAQLSWRPGQAMVNMYENLLGLELEVARHDKRAFTERQVAMLQQVLERPVSRQRQDLGDRQVEVCSVSMNLNAHPLALAFGSAWVMRQPRHPEDGLLFWSAQSGLRSLENEGALLEWLGNRFAIPERRSQWLKVFSEQDRSRVDQSFAAALPPVFTLHLKNEDRHFIERLEEDEQRRQQQELDSVLRQFRANRLTAGASRRYFELATGNEQLLGWLDSLAIRIQDLMFAAILPDWVREASQSDLEHYSDLLKRYYLEGNPADDFLADIPLLRNFAHEQLLAALLQDFPGHVLDPQRITVTMTSYIAAPVPLGSIPSGIAAATVVNSETLVEFALNHFSRLQEASLSVSHADAVVLPSGLTGQYLSSLIHRLDVGQRYQTLLASHFDPRQENHADRLDRFMRQVPARLLLPALELKMQGRLSDKAFDFIQCVTDMPDARARQPVHGQHIVLRPLALRPRKDMSSDPVQGLFLIGPQDLGEGPVVLQMLFNDSFSFKEFESRDDVLQHLRDSPRLQTLVLDRVDPQVRKRYQHGGLIEAHIPWSTEGFMDVPLSPDPVTLDTAVVEGNALRYLFDAILQLLQDLSRKQTVTSAQADWASFVHLMTLGAEQILTFLPGKLGMLVAAWQSQTMLRASAGAALEQHWGKALSEFSAALGVLVMNRREEVEVAGNRPHSRLPEFSWRNSMLTPDLRRRLRQFEVRDIELEQLEYDPLYNLYRDTHTLRKYAAVAGQVYEVEEHEGLWRIRGGDDSGPMIRLNQSQQWELNLALGLRGGGKPTPVQIDTYLRDKIDRYMVVQARGMDEIRVYSREQARQIGMARHQALGYLQTTLFNLNAPFAEGLPVPVRRVLEDFFGMPRLDTGLIDGFRQRVDELFMGLSEPSLSRLDSNRFVIGVLKPTYEDMAAFVFPSDPDKRIFLGDMFFAPPLYDVRADYGAHTFNADDHFRAIALLHELSHLVSNTQDIAYLDASAPPLEVLEDAPAGTRGYKQHLQHLRETALSHRTPATRLFTTKVGGTWRDFQARDGQAMATILRLSGQPTLVRARQLFLSDAHIRRRIILANADSIVMLIALLGRQRFV